MSADYDELLNRTWEEVPEPELLPAGQWLLVGKNVGLVMPREDGQSMKILYTYTAKSPVNVAEDLLEELGEYDFTVNELQFTQYIEGAASLNDVRKHLAKHGIEVQGSIKGADGKLSFGKAFRGAEIVAEVGQRSYENSAGETIWQNSTSKFQAVEE